MAATRGATGIPHTLWRGGVIWYRRRWPTNLRSHFAREFHEESLKTADKGIALNAASRVNLWFDDQVRKAREPTPLSRAVDRVEAMEPTDRARYIHDVYKVIGPEVRWFTKPDGTLDGEFVAGLPDKDVKRLIERLVEEIQDISDVFRIKAQRTHVPGGVDWNAALDDGNDATMKQMVSHLTKLLARIGNPEELLSKEAAEQVKEESFTTLVDLAEKWGAKNDAPEQHIAQYRYACKLFCELHGYKDVRTITTRQIGEFEDEVARMPKSTRKDIRAADMLTAIKIADAENLERIGRSTVNKHISAIKTVLNFGVDRGVLEKNPGATNRIKKQKRGKQPRRNYTRAELDKLIKHIGENLKPNSDDFWIPFIALMHGARREEVCQLEKADIQQVGDIWCMNIRVMSENEDEEDEDGEDEADEEGHEKSLKTSNSRRLMPIHPLALRMGFVAFAKASPNGRVFASLEPDKRGDLGGSYGKRFMRRLRNKVGFKDKRLVFHSLRHSFITECRNADLPETMEHTLSGHAGGSVVHDGYGSRQEVPNRLKWLSKVDFHSPALIELVERMEREREGAGEA